MKKSVLSRTLSLVLAVFMVVGLLPTLTLVGAANEDKPAGVYFSSFASEEIASEIEDYDECYVYFVGENKADLGHVILNEQNPYSAFPEGVRYLKVYCYASQMPRQVRIDCYNAPNSADAIYQLENDGFIYLEVGNINDVVNIEFDYNEDHGGDPQPNEDAGIYLNTFGPEDASENIDNYGEYTISFYDAESSLVSMDVVDQENNYLAFPEGTAFICVCPTATEIPMQINISCYNAPSSDDAISSIEEFGYIWLELGNINDVVTLDFIYQGYENENPEPPQSTGLNIEVDTNDEIASVDVTVDFYDVDGEQIGDSAIYEDAYGFENLPIPEGAAIFMISIDSEAELLDVDYDMPGDYNHDVILENYKTDGNYIFDVDPEVDTYNIAFRYVTHEYHPDGVMIYNWNEALNYSIDAYVPARPHVIESQWKLIELEPGQSIFVWANDFNGVEAIYKRGEMLNIAPQIIDGVYVYEIEYDEYADFEVYSNPDDEPGLGQMRLDIDASRYEIYINGNLYGADAIIDFTTEESLEMLIVPSEEANQEMCIVEIDGNQSELEYDKELGGFSFAASFDSYNKQYLHVYGSYEEAEYYSFGITDDDQFLVEMYGIDEEHFGTISYEEDSIDSIRFEDKERVLFSTELDTIYYTVDLCEGVEVDYVEVYYPWSDEPEQICGELTEDGQYQFTLPVCNAEWINVSVIYVEQEDENEYLPTLNHLVIIPDIDDAFLVRYAKGEYDGPESFSAAQGLVEVNREDFVWNENDDNSIVVYLEELGTYTFIIVYPNGEEDVFIRPALAVVGNFDVIADTDELTLTLSDICAEEMAVIDIAKGSFDSYEDMVDSIVYTIDPSEVENETAQWTAEEDGTYTICVRHTDVEVPDQIFTVVLEKKVVENPFIDVPEGKWYTEGVLYCYERGFVNGTSENTFAPSTNLTRRDIIVILANMMCEDTSVYADTQTFTDVAKGTWYHDAVEWAVANGVSSGTSATTFNPKGQLTRQELAVLLYNVAGSPDVEIDLGAFTDGATVSSWAKKAMTWAVQNNLLAGSGGKCMPKAVATRAQAAVIIMNFDKNIVQ